MTELEFTHTRSRNWGSPIVLLSASVLAFLALTEATQAQINSIDCNSQLIGSSQGSELFTVDIATGSGTLIGTMANSLATEVEYDRFGNDLWAEEVSVNQLLHRIDLTDGSTLSTVSHLAGALTGLEFVGSTLYGTFIASTGGATPSDLVTVNTASGALTTIGATGFGPISGLAYDETTNTMYGVTAGSGASNLITLNLTTGLGTLVGATGYSAVGSIEFGPDGNLYGGIASGGSTDPNGFIRINPATGLGALVGNTGFSVTGLTSCAAPAVVEVPTLSPLSLALLALVVALVGGLALRRRTFP